MGRTGGEPFWSSRAAAIIEMLLTQQPGSRNDAALCAVHMDELGNVAQHIFDRHPDIRIEPGVESSVFGFELSLAAAI